MLFSARLVPVCAHLRAAHTKVALLAFVKR